MKCVPVMVSSPLRHWNIQHLEQVETIFHTYVFSPEEQVHACEITPSYRLQYVSTTVAPKCDAPKAIAEELQELEHDPSISQDDLLVQVHAIGSYVQGAPLDFESVDEATEYYQCNSPF